MGSGGPSFADSWGTKEVHSRRSKSKSPEPETLSPKIKRQGFRKRVRIGSKFQVKLPDLIPTQGRNSEKYRDRAILLWRPCPNLNDDDIDEFVVYSKQYGYHEDQALGILFWHRYSTAKAVKDVKRFSAYRKDWTSDDKCLFQEAFELYGKQFDKIKECLPDKCMRSIINYYYGWK